VNRHHIYTCQSRVELHQLWDRGEAVLDQADDRPQGSFERAEVTGHTRTAPRTSTTRWAFDIDALPLTSSAAHEVRADSGEEAYAAPLAQLYLWDPWPVLDDAGEMADVHGQQWWIVLSADRGVHPEARHDHARLRLLRRERDGWHDLGELFPDGASPGSREWSGTAVFDEASSRLRVLYTATGMRGEARPTFQQRLFEACAEVHGARIVSWSAHTELVAAAAPYLPADESVAAPGLCRAFRDPFFFRDPADGAQYLLFAASLPDSDQDHAGAVGIATHRHGSWEPQPPLLDAVGVNRELERPHLLHRAGHYYLFFSTHGQSFHPSLPGRTGLYGFHAETVHGPYRPLNDSGLVLANPDHAPYAQYAWQVLSDDRVVSFSNYPSSGPGPLRDDAVFAGTISPFLRLRLQGATAKLEAVTLGTAP
jgi:levansucrase